MRSDRLSAVALSHGRQSILREGALMTGQTKPGAMLADPRHPDAALLALGREIAEVKILLSRASTLSFECDNLCGELIADRMESAEAERQTGVLPFGRSGGKARLHTLQPAL